ncbi:uncharacterized protein LOC143228677 [Tachypleus tridentatus]|uniref:uncharacterized protein LOC143228677 n=1 Tax=Tachypleus tridentatus TaxID=6853 RepID=UPI003FD2BCB7
MSQAFQVIFFLLWLTLLSHPAQGWICNHDICITILEQSTNKSYAEQQCLKENGSLLKLLSVDHWRNIRDLLLQRNNTLETLWTAMYFDPDSVSWRSEKETVLNTSSLPWLLVNVTPDSENKTCGCLRKSSYYKLDLCDCSSTFPSICHQIGKYLFSLYP